MALAHRAADPPRQPRRRSPRRDHRDQPARVTALVNAHVNRHAVRLQPAGSGSGVRGQPVDSRQSADADARISRSPSSPGEIHHDIHYTRPGPFTIPTRPRSTLRTRPCGPRRCTSSRRSAMRLRRRCCWPSPTIGRRRRSSDPANMATTRSNAVHDADSASVGLTNVKVYSVTRTCT